jgi:hypothetical protein
MMAAFPTATFHFFSDTETWKSDVVRERLEPVGGFVRVPERPGLGVTLDRDELGRLERLELPAQKPWIICSRFASGAEMYNIADPRDSLFLVRPDRRRQITLSYASSISTRYWDEDGSAEFAEMFARVEREGMILERPKQEDSP